MSFSGSNGKGSRFRQVRMGSTPDKWEIQQIVDISLIERIFLLSLAIQ